MSHIRIKPPDFHTVMKVTPCLGAAIDYHRAAHGARAPDPLDHPSKLSSKAANGSSGRVDCELWAAVMPAEPARHGRLGLQEAAITPVQPRDVSPLRSRRRWRSAGQSSGTVRKRRNETRHGHRQLSSR
jgi:hypothetical protein